MPMHFAVKKVIEADDVRLLLQNFELRAEFLNAFNFINFTTNSLSQNGGMSSVNWAQVTSAYRDIVNTNETGGRMVQIVLRLNF